jgi:hypothetical protein
VSRINVDRVVAAYQSGESTVSLARALRKSPTWVRRLLLAHGVELRDRAAAAALAYQKKRRPQVRRPLSDEVRARIAAGVRAGGGGGGGGGRAPPPPPPRRTNSWWAAGS